MPSIRNPSDVWFSSCASWNAVQRCLSSAATHAFDVTDPAFDWAEIGERWFFELCKKHFTCQISLLKAVALLHRRLAMISFTYFFAGMSEDHLCTLSFVEMSKERSTRKCGKNTDSFVASWALAYSRNRPCNFSCLLAVSTNCRLCSFSRLWGGIWRGKSFRDQQRQFRSNKKKEFELRKRIKLFDDFWVPIRFSPEVRV